MAQRVKTAQAGEHQQINKQTDARTDATKRIIYPASQSWNIPILPIRIFNFCMQKLMPIWIISIYEHSSFGKFSYKKLICINLICINLILIDDMLYKNVNQ